MWICKKCEKSHPAVPVPGCKECNTFMFGIVRCDKHMVAFYCEHNKSAIGTALYKVAHIAMPGFIHRWIRGLIYKSERVGRGGRIFEMYKIRTLKPGSDGKMFASGDAYKFGGRFLRRYKLDELPQLINVLKGEMSLVGPRPEEKRTLDVIPEDIRRTILKVKPGCTDLASLFFFDEEKLLTRSEDKLLDYWGKIKPIKFVLQAFYVENRCFSLDCWILWQTLKRIIKEIF